MCPQKGWGAQIVILRVTSCGGHCQIRIDLNDKKIEVRVTLSDPVNFRGVGVADRAIVPIKNQRRCRFSSEIERMAQFAPAGSASAGLASFARANGNRDKKTKRESFYGSHSTFLAFFTAELKP